MAICVILFDADPLEFDPLEFQESDTGRLRDEDYRELSYRSPEWLEISA
jgi:hypothetical protein